VCTQNIGYAVLSHYDESRHGQRPGTGNAETAFHLVGISRDGFRTVGNLPDHRALAAAALGWGLNIGSPRSFICFWAGVSVVALGGSFLLVRRQALKESEPFWSPPSGTPRSTLPRAAPKKTISRMLAAENAASKNAHDACRIFPTVIEVTEKALTRRKRRLFGCDEISIGISKVASVHIKTGMIWSEILIESTGGADPLTSRGHTKSDARRIRDLVQAYQAAETPSQKEG